MNDTCVRNRGTRFYLPPEQLRALKAAAAEEDRSMSDILRELVTAYLDRRRGEDRGGRRRH